MVLAGTAGKNHFSDCSEASDLRDVKSSTDFIPVHILKETAPFPLPQWHFMLSPLQSPVSQWTSDKRPEGKMSNYRKQQAE